MTDRSAFVSITYQIWLSTHAVQVKGYAFETPGWPEWHACVRYGNRWGDGLFNDWIIDHYESGFAVSGAGVLARKEDAPAAMLKLLEEKGRKLVRIKLRAAFS